MLVEISEAINLPILKKIMATTQMNHDSNTIEPSDLNSTFLLCVSIVFSFTVLNDLYKIIAYTSSLHEGKT